MKEAFYTYPHKKKVYETSDGGVHLTFEEARAQAAHLEDSSIKTHKRTRTNESGLTTTT